jgi:hypothetical protein
MSEQKDCTIPKSGGMLKLSIGAGFLSAVYYRADYRTALQDGSLSPWKLIGYYNGNYNGSEPLGPNRSFDVADCMLLNGGRVRIEYLLAKVDPNNPADYQLRSTLSAGAAIDHGDIVLSGSTDALLTPQIARFNLTVGQ